MKENYSVQLNAIMKKYNLEGGFLHSTYERGINSENFTSCYVDSRVTNASKIKKELSYLLDDYFIDFPKANRPLYSYK